MDTNNTSKTRVIIKIVLMMCYQYRGSENQKELEKLYLIYRKYTIIALI